MDDDRKNTPRKGGPRTSGPRRTDGPAKAGLGGKPRAEGGKKPFVKRPVGAEPKREFKRDDRPTGERPPAGAKPFRKGPPRDGKPFEKRAPRDGEKRPFVRRDGEAAPAERSAGADRPFRKGPPRDGKPFEKRAPRDGEKRPFVRREEGDRPKRDFKPREGAAERPARFEARSDDAPRPPRGDKPFRPGPRDGERKPFVRREDGATERPKRDFQPRGDGDRPSKSFDRQKSDGAERKPFARDKDPVEPGERIAKRLARAGIASRRDAEDLIAAGRVKINGRKLESPAVNVMIDDTIEVDGMAIPAIERTRLFLFHKPAGVVTTNRDPEGRKTVFDVLPADLPRLMTIGRLDINTEGLLLLTNDGGLSRVLELPATGWLRRYRVRVHGKVDEKVLPGLKDGIAVDGVFYGSVEATLDREQGSNAWMTIGLREGKNREVKNILGALGLEVSRLIRISYGPFQLNDLPEGHVQEIKGKLLRDQLGERLIEEAGANFEAPIVNPFSNDPVKRAPEPRPEVAERPKIMRDGERGRIGEGGLIKNRKRREGSRDEALGKLSTRPERGPKKFERGEKPKFERGDKPRGPAKFGHSPDRFATFAEKPGPAPPPGKKPEREQKPIEPPGVRKANVWMAPGARPIGAGRAAAEKAEVEAKRAAKKTTYGKPAGKTRDGAPPRSRSGPGDGSAPRPPRKGPNGPARS